MTIPPYTFGSGEEWGGHEPPPLPRSEKGDLARRFRRVKKDPGWRDLSEREKRALLAADRRDEREGFR